MTEPPRPPRKVQAPKVRQHERRPSEASESRQKVMLYALAASGLIGLAVVLVIVLTGGGGGTGTGDAAAVRADMEQAGCTFKSVQAASSGNHIQSLSVKVKYNTFPPTSGPHFPTPAPWGIYDDPINQKILVHNLEHGGIVVQYGSKAPADTKQQLAAFFQDSPNGIVVDPLPALGNKISLGAWTAEDYSKVEGTPKPGTAYLAICPRYDEKAFKAFRDAFRYQGPERIPPDLMQPGQ